MTDRRGVIVIGGGVNGLAAATVLARAGLAVTLLERGETVGGLGCALEFAPGFRTVPTGAEDAWLPPAVARALRLRALARAVPDTPLTAVVAPGEFLPLARDPALAAAAVRRYSTRDAAAWPGFITQTHRLAGVLAALYQQPALDPTGAAPRDVLRLLRAGLALRALGRTDMTELLRMVPMSVRELVDDRFECAPLKAAVAASGVRDIRQGPRAGGTGFVWLHHLVGVARGAVRDRGHWRDGPDAGVHALAAGARQAGVAVRTGCRVARILVADDAVTGVALADGEEIAAAHVVSTADPATTLLGMVDPVWLDPELRHAVEHIKFRGATAIALFALDALPDRAGLPAGSLAGTLSLTPHLDVLERAADAAKYGEMSEHPHIELSAPTLRWPALAPAGNHVVVARVQYAPFHLAAGHVWDGTRREALADRITHLIDAALPGFHDRVLHRALFTPAEIGARYGLSEGALTHGELTLDQVLFMRPLPGLAHYATPVAGLYLGGAGTHPGPGVIGGPGWLAARRVLRDVRGAARP